MAHSMGLNSLPLEVLEVIVTYLSAADLTRCLAVNRTWYNIFSNDVFWKKHCTGTATRNDYFSRVKCLVEPEFKPPTEIQDHQKYRLQFLQERHLWKNWESGRYKMEEIVFDCDDSISYNIKVSFLDNDHVCLHRTSETEVWNVTETPFLVMTVPYCLNEMWEQNVYKVFDDILVAIQCNVVQVYEINLGSKSWCRKHLFFFNKPEEFSSSITPETNINVLFKSLAKACWDEDKYERFICGEYFVGVYNGEESPILHVWNIKTGKKIKEQKFENCKGKYSIELGVPRIKTSKVLITFKFKGKVTSKPGEDNLMADSCGRKCCSVVYDLSRLQLILPTRRYHSGDVVYFDGNLSVVQDKALIILRHHSSGPDENETQNIITEDPPKEFQCFHSVEPLGSNLLISTREEVFLVNTSDFTVQNLKALSLIKVDFYLCRLNVLFNQYALLHDVDYETIKEIWKVGQSLKKVMEFPPDSGSYIASNSIGSRVVLEKGNILIVLNFW